VQRPRDRRVVVTLLLQKGAQQPWFDVAVAFAVDPIAEIGIVQRISEQLHDALLGFLFDLADGAHASISCRRSGDQTLWTRADTSSRRSICSSLPYLSKGLKGRLCVLRKA